MIFNRYVSDITEAEYDIKAYEKLKVKIPEGRYDVIVPSEALLTPDECKWMCSVNNGDYQKQKYDSKRRCVLSISQMLEIYQEGYKISLVFKDDAIEIYNKLQDYLERVQGIYRDEMEDMFDIQEDLRLIDNFASSVFTNNNKTIVSQNANIYKPIKTIGQLGSKYMSRDIKPIGYTEQKNEDDGYMVSRYTSEEETNGGFNQPKEYNLYKEPKLNLDYNRTSVYENIHKLKAEREALKLKNSTLVDVKDSYGKFNL